MEAEEFCNTLLRWHQNIDRQLPWKSTNDPYKIWISEIILQQTRVKHGLAYYHRLISLFPDVETLAKAKEIEVLNAWKGLGYYTRARNLHRAAKQILIDFDGTFPESYEEIIQLKGVGPYTAAAIASFAFDLPYAVVDGNVYRILSRYFGEPSPIDTSAGKKSFSDLADRCLDRNKSSFYNQAIMDFGALVCTPRTPKCQSCPLQKTCIAFATNTIDQRPVKSKKITIKKRYFTYFIIQNDHSVLLTRRKKNDIWKGLYELPMFETSKKESRAEVEHILNSKLNARQINLKFALENQQRLTHQLIFGSFYTATFAAPFLELIEDIEWVSKVKLSKLAMPKIVDNALKKLL